MRHESRFKRESNDLVVPYWLFLAVQVTVYVELPSELISFLLSPSRMKLGKLRTALSLLCNDTDFF